MHVVPAEEAFSRHSCLVKHKQNNVIITSLVGTAGMRQETGGHDKQHYYIKSYIYRVLSGPICVLPLIVNCQVQEVY